MAKIAGQLRTLTDALRAWRDVSFDDDSAVVVEAGDAVARAAMDVFGWTAEDLNTREEVKHEREDCTAAH